MERAVRLLDSFADNSTHTTRRRESPQEFNHQLLSQPFLILALLGAAGRMVHGPYFNVRTGEPCRITTGDPTSKGMIAVRSFRSVLNAYVNNAESKFDGPDGKQCSSWTR